MFRRSKSLDNRRKNSECSKNFEFDSFLTSLDSSKFQIHIFFIIICTTFGRLSHLPHDECVRRALQIFVCTQKSTQKVILRETKSISYSNSRRAWPIRRIKCH